jgi:hypothetical protein
MTMRSITARFGVFLLACGAPSYAAAPTTTRDIGAIVKGISAQRIEARIRKLADFGTRHSLSETASETRGIGAARRWISAELTECSRAAGGRLQVTLDEFVAESSARVPTPTTMVNVVATLPGNQIESRERIYVVSGHYDSMPSSVMDANTDAPGANDDASGTAAVMEMACVMANYSFDATLVFLTVTGEEQGLLGSTHWAKEAHEKRQDVAGMFTNDIIGSSRGADGKSYANRVRVFAEGVPPSKEPPEELRTRISTGGENDSPARELARFVKEQAERHVQGMSVDVIYRRDRYQRGGDHQPFLEQGFAAIRFVEASENFRHQHQNVRKENGVQYGDLPEFVDFEYVASIARINAVALAALASAPAAPQDAAIETIKLENDTTLRWTANSEPDVAGYRIVWRDTTAPFWQHRRDVGNVTRYTLEGISKDDYVFGVVALDKDGNESVASYPKPYRPARN